MKIYVTIEVPENFIKAYSAALDIQFNEAAQKNHIANLYHSFISEKGNTEWDQDDFETFILNQTV